MRLYFMYHAGFIEFLLAALLQLVPLRWAWCNSHLHIIKITAFACPAHLDKGGMPG